MRRRRRGLHSARGHVRGRQWPRSRRTTRSRSASSGTIDAGNRARRRSKRTRPRSSGPEPTGSTIRRNGGPSFSVFHVNGTGRAAPGRRNGHGRRQGRRPVGAFSLGLGGNALTLEKVTVIGNTAIGSAGGRHLQRRRPARDRSEHDLRQPCSNGRRHHRLRIWERANRPRSRGARSPGNSSTTATTAGGIYLNDAPAGIRGSTVAGNVGTGAGAANSCSDRHLAGDDQEQHRCGPDRRGRILPHRRRRDLHVRGLQPQGGHDLRSRPSNGHHRRPEARRR